jgi:NADH-quinone oxidoreductase subunit G
LEDAYAYAKFARVALGSNDIDFRARAHSAEESWFLSNRVAGRPLTVTYADLAVAPVVLLVGLEPEEESPILFLRLRKAVRADGLPVYSIGPFASRGLTKMGGKLLAAAPGDEYQVLDSLHRGHIADLLRSPGAAIVVGERLATSPGALSAAARLADGTGAQLAWVPRRAGERGALEAGAFPTLLPGGRRTGHPGRDTGAIISDAAQGHLAALVVGGVELDDLPDSQTARRALQATPFVVSLEVRESAVTQHADVVFPVATVQEKAGTFVNWEGRHRFFTAAMPETGALSDLRVLDALAAEMGIQLSLPDDATAREDLRRLGDRPPAQEVSPPVSIPTGLRPIAGQAVLATWRQLLDAGRLQDGQPHLAGTARTPVALLSPATAAEIGVAEHQLVSISTAKGSITLPAEFTRMTHRVVWVPMNSPGSAVNVQLGVTAGAVVDIRRAD